MCHNLLVRKPITGCHTLRGGDYIDKGMDMRVGGPSRSVHHNVQASPICYSYLPHLLTFMFEIFLNKKNYSL